MAILAPYPKLRFFDSSGDPLSGGKLYTYVAGGVVPATTYTDQTGGTANPNPVVLDGAGEAAVWLDPAVSYKFVLADSDDVVQYTVDGVNIASPTYVTTLDASSTATLAKVTIDTAASTALEMNAAGELGIAASNAAGTIGMYLNGTRYFLLNGSTCTITRPEVRAKQAGDVSFYLEDSTGRSFSLKNSASTVALRDETAGAARLTFDSSGNATFAQAVTETGNDTCLANRILQSANGAQLIHGQISEEITLSTTGATTDSSQNLLPATAIILGVVARVTTTITIATDWAVGDGTTPARFCAANATMTAGTTSTTSGTAWTTGIASATTGMKQTAAAKVRITTTGTPGAGKIRVTVFYAQSVAPTS